MEFNEKLQHLRKKSGITQEELAEVLYVSRTAVSKWESGRGYPSIDSLKQIAKYFSVTMDELLSGDELLTIAEEDSKIKEKHLHDLLFGLLDISSSMLFFLPFFADKNGEVIRAASLLALSQISQYLKVAFFSLTIATVVFGILTLTLQNFSNLFWIRFKRLGSFMLNALLTLVFVISLQPYAAVFLFLFLIIKALMLIKWR